MMFAPQIPMPCGAILYLTVDPSMCPTSACDVSCMAACTYEWWNKEYKGGAK